MLLLPLYPPRLVLVEVSCPALRRFLDKLHIHLYGRRIVTVRRLTMSNTRRIGKQGSAGGIHPAAHLAQSIICELTNDGRMPVTQVAENVQISRAQAFTGSAGLPVRGCCPDSRRLFTLFKASAGSSAYASLNLKQSSSGELQPRKGRSNGEREVDGRQRTGHGWAKLVERLSVVPRPSFSASRHTGR